MGGQLAQFVLALLLGSAQAPATLTADQVAMDPANWSRDHIVEVAVAPRKPNGKKWDAGFGGITNPDISICVADLTSGSAGLSCVENKDFRRGLCKNTMQCQIAQVAFPSRDAFVYVFDMDLRKHDLIAFGKCRVGAKCNFGAATIKVRPIN